MKKSPLSKLMGAGNEFEIAVAIALVLALCAIVPCAVLLWKLCRHFVAR